ncbi:hypothetical protein OAS42_02065 [bacterium]|nr:hypothetical protein [bacterium]
MNNNTATKLSAFRGKGLSMPRETIITDSINKATSPSIQNDAARRGALRSMVEFEKAHSRYRALDFEQAINGYKKCLELVPDDGPSRVFLNRCESYLTSPPPQDWDGVFTLTEKG